MSGASRTRLSDGAGWGVVMRVGVDIVEIDRVGQALARHGDRFLRRVYSEREVAYCAGRVPSLAARFAAKEAVAKALGTGIGDLNWRDIEVLPGDGGRPVVLLHGRAATTARSLGVADCEVSLAHTRDYAVASAVAFGPGPSP